MCDKVTSDKHDLSRKNGLTLSASPSAPAPGSDELSTAEGVLRGLESLQMIHAQCKGPPSAGTAL